MKDECSALSAAEKHGPVESGKRTERSYSFKKMFLCAEGATDIS